MFRVHSLKMLFSLALSLSAVAVELGATEVSNQTAGGLPLIIPQVQSMDVGTAKVSLPKVMTAAMPVPVNMENLAAELRKRGVGLKEDKNAFLQLEISPEVMKGKPEGYQLEIKANGIKITAGTPAGLFYGIQTLADMVRNTAELPECRIEDYPDLAMRGVYLNVRGLQPSQVPAFKQVMNFLAGLKLNTMVLEFADNFPLKSVKFKRKFTLSESDILDIKKHADELHMEIIPLLQCLSHVLWMSGYENFDGILEKSKDGSINKSWNAAICPSNPEAQKVIAGVIRDTAALLRPRYFHLGLDEVNYGPFHECEQCRKVPTEELFWSQVKTLEEEAERNHAIPIFYQDTFLPQSIRHTIANKAQGEKVIDRVSRKTVINVWDYCNNPRAAWTEFFIDRNFPVLGASSCYNLRNNQMLPQLMKQSKGALGCFITYWHYIAGPLIAPARDSSLAVASTIVVANYCWNCGGRPCENITFDPAYEYARRFSNAPEPFEKKAVAVNLDPQVNFQFGSDKAFPQFTPEELDKLAAELQGLPEKFNLQKNGTGNYYGILLSGNADDDQEAAPRQIPFNGKAGRLAFLMTTSRPQNMDLFARWDQVKLQPNIGQLAVNYSDGGKVEIPLRYNGNIVDWNADCGGYGCRIVNRGNDKRDALYQLTVLDWINPQPGKEIKSITFGTERTEGIMPVLLAISAEDSTYSRPAGALPEKCRDSVSSAAAQTHDEVNITRIAEGRLFPQPAVSGIGYNKKLTEENTPDGGPDHTPAITVTIPPTAGKITGRVNFDFAVPAHSGFKTLRIAYRCVTPLPLNESGIYLGNDGFAKYVSKFGIFDGKAGKWQELVIPVSSLSQESSGIDIHAVTRFRIVLWLDNRKKVVLQLGRITGTGETTMVQYPLRRSIAD